MSDPGQQNPLRDDALEARFLALMRGHLARIQAPAEQFERLGL